MNKKTFFIIAGVIFLVVALLHLYRILTLTDVVIDDWSIPFWFSPIALIVAFYLSWQGFKFSKETASSQSIAHYVCSGECGGISDKPGFCRAENCSRKGKPLKKCVCSDNKHSSLSVKQ